MEQQEIRIQPVKDNTDKYKTYKTNLTKYKLALKGGFLFEALLIDYAMIEDRLRSMLYHMAYFYDSNFNCWKKTKPLFTNIVKSYKEEHESDTFDTNKISGKIKLIRCVIRWAHNTNECYNKKSYQSALKQRCENIDIEETFNNLVKWCQ